MIGRTGLYRLYAGNGVLLYVGISNDPDKRFTGHADKAWRPLVTRRDVCWYPNRRTAEAAERQAIVGEHPLFNNTYNGGADILWKKLLGSPVLRSWRLPVFAAVVDLEPRLVEVLRDAWSHEETCPDCAWPDLKKRVSGLVGMFADTDDDRIRDPHVYEAVVSTLYESLPWLACAPCQGFVPDRVA